MVWDTGFSPTWLPGNQKMGSYDIGEERTAPHCRLQSCSHGHASSLSCRSPHNSIPWYSSLSFGIFISCGHEGRGSLAHLLIFSLFSYGLNFIPRDFRAQIFGPYPEHLLQIQDLNSNANIWKIKTPRIVLFGLSIHHLRQAVGVAQLPEWQVGPLNTNKEKFQIILQSFILP